MINEVQSRLKYPHFLYFYAKMDAYEEKGEAKMTKSDRLRRDGWKMVILSIILATIGIILVLVYSHPLGWVCWGGSLMGFFYGGMAIGIERNERNLNPRINQDQTLDVDNFKGS